MANKTHGSQSHPAGFGQIDETVKRLVQVPKDELDKEEKKYQRMRTRVKKKRAAKGKK